MAPNLTRTRLIRSSGHTGVIRSVTSTLASLTAIAGASTTSTFTYGGAGNPLSIHGLGNALTCRYLWGYLQWPVNLQTLRRTYL